MYNTFMNGLVDNLIAENPNEGCFLCRPEKWRILYSGNAVQVVAGLGPLVNGYILVSPKEHVHTLAEASSALVREMHSVFEVTRDALRVQYGPGYTAYEHAKVGSCRIVEEKQEIDHFCFHSHRVFIPVVTTLQADISRFFESSVSISAPEQMRELSGKEYVYYETENSHSARTAHAYLGPKDVPSQFLRRLISRQLSLDIGYSWAAAPRLEQMIETVATLRGELAGLSSITAPANSSRLSLPGYVSIDGPSGTGKSTVAMHLSSRYGCRVVDSGLAFRRFAAGRAGLLPAATVDHFADLFNLGERVPLPRGNEIHQALTECVADPTLRATVKSILRMTIDRIGPCIVIGRDAWSTVPDSAKRIVLSADIRTRMRRSVLRVGVMDHGKIGPVENVESFLRAEESHAIRLEPTEGTPGVIRVENGKRPFHSTMLDVLAHLENS